MLVQRAVTTRMRVLCTWMIRNPAHILQFKDLWLLPSSPDIRTLSIKSHGYLSRFDPNDKPATPALRWSRPPTLSGSTHLEFESRIGYISPFSPHRQMFNAISRIYRIIYLIGPYLWHLGLLLNTFLNIPPLPIIRSKLRIAHTHTNHRNYCDARVPRTNIICSEPSLRHTHIIDIFKA